MKSYRTSYADWGAGEYLAIARCLFGCRVHEGPDIARLANRLRAMYFPSEALLLNFGHVGIEIALSWFQLLRKDAKEVVVPAYICPSVPRAVQSVGLQVRYVPVGGDLNLTVEAVQSVIGPSTLAVIAPHMYGCPAPIKSLEDLCKDAGVYLIDDAAQVVGEGVGDRLLGSFGDVGIISFAQSKSVVTGIRGSGGALLINNPFWKSLALETSRKLPPARHRLGPLLDFLWNYVGHAYTGSSGYYLGRLVRELGLSAPEPEMQTQISNLEAAVALRQFDRLKEMRSERLRVVRAYHEALKPQALVTFPQYAPERYLSRVVLSLPVGEHWQRVMKELAKNGVQSRAPYPLISGNKIVPSSGGEGSVGDRLIGLPAASGLTSDEILDICSRLFAVIDQRKTAGT